MNTAGLPHHTATTLEAGFASGLAGLVLPYNFFIGNRYRNGSVNPRILNKKTIVVIFSIVLAYSRSTLNRLSEGIDLIKFAAFNT
jgi:hypothetical protein